jgi:hypothetical protein
MLTEIVVGGVTSLVNLVIHALLITAASHAVLGLSVRDTELPTYLQRVIVIVATGTLLVAGHLVEVMLWALTYEIVGAAPPGTDLVYFAFGNYTTLGYGDVIPIEGWRILGPMTALNGILLIGWSTALIFQVLRRTNPEWGKR